MKPYIIILLIIASITLRAQTPLEGYIAEASERNPQVQARFSDYYAALEKIPQARALPYPVVAFGYFIQPVETKNGPQQLKISTTQMLPWLGTRKTNASAAEHMAQAKYEAFEHSLQELRYLLKATYYSLYFTGRAIASTDENIKLLQSLKNMADIKVASGSASSIDMLRVQMDINELENQHALLRDKLWAQQVAFNNLCNAESNRQIQISDSLVPEPLAFDKQTVIDSITAHNSSLNMFDYQLSALGYRKTSAKKAGMPKISVGFDYTFIGEGNSTSPDAGKDAFMFPRIGIVVPLYRSKYRALEQEALFNIEAKEHEKSALANELENMLETAWKDQQDAQRRTDLYRQQTELAQQALSILETSYSSSGANFEELLRMERKLLKYQLEKERASADAATAGAFIEKLMK